MISPRLQRIVERAYERPMEQQEMYAELLERMLEQVSPSMPSSDELRNIIAESMKKHADTLTFLKDK